MDNDYGFSSFRYYVKVASIIVVVIALLVILGWYSNTAPLKSIIPNAASMKFNTAFSLLCAGTSLWLLKNETALSKEKQVGQVLAGLTLVIGLFSLSEYVFGWDLGIDQLFIRDLDTSPNAFPGRMSEITAAGFTLLSLALLSINSRTSRYFSTSVVLLSLLAVIGYLFDYRSLYQLVGYRSIALHTAITFLLLSTAILAARPSHGVMEMITSNLSGSRVLRPLLPTTIILIVLLGWLVELGDQLGILNSNNESVVLVVLLIFIYSPLIYIYTERINQSEKEIKRSEERYRSTLDNMLEGCQIIDFDWRYAFLNKAAAGQGHRKAEELLHHTMMEMYPGIENTELFSVLRDCMENRVARQMENEFTFPDGSSGWFQLSIQPVPEGIFILSVDLTGRKQAEERIQDLALFPEENPYPVLRVDTSGKIIYANTASRLLLGEWHCEIGDVLPPTWKALSVDLIANDTKETVEVNCRDLIYSITFAPVSQRGYVNLYGRDITERKRAEEKIQRQLRFLNSLRTIDLAISTSFDIRTTFEIVLQQVALQLGVDAAAILLINTQNESMEYSASQGFRTSVLHRAQLKLGEGLGGSAWRERRTIHIRNLTEADRKFAERMPFAGEGFTEYYGIPLIVKDKTEGVLEIYHRSSLYVDEEWSILLEALAGQAAIAIDNALLWERIQGQNRELEQRVAVRTTQLNQTNLELDRANRAKDEFLATMTHELRTPLNSILGLSESLLEQRRDPLTDHQIHSLQIIEASGHHLLELINDVLDLSKIEAGKLDYYPQVVDVNTLCRSSLAFVREQATRKSIQLIFEEDKVDIKIHADPRRLKQVLVNLLTNAVKFTSEHGRVTLQIYTDVEEDLVQFSVIDTGVGIAEKDLRQLFQPFVQVDSNLNRQFEGTGLGLALVQKLTDLHGGSVNVESEVGAGSRFTINIPWGRLLVAQQEVIEKGGELALVEKSQNSDVPLGDTSGHGVVLLAEDNEANIITIGEYLESQGYTMVNTHDGIEAIEKAQETNPDIILMDIQMPAMDGLEAIRRLRADPRFDTTPIIALTALAMPGDRERCLEAGANEYMSKPVSLKKLVKTIGNLLA